MPNLLSLATETLAHIAQFCDEPSQVVEIVRASRRLHEIFHPELYRIAIETQHPGMTVLAAAEGRLETLKTAASFSADLNREYPVPPPAWVLGRWPGVDAPPHACWGTPLHLAVRSGHIHVVKWLLEQNVDVDSPGRYLCRCVDVYSQGPGSMDEPPPRRVSIDMYEAFMPLHLAICNRQDSLAHLLLDAGAYFNTLGNTTPDCGRPHNAPRLLNRNNRDWQCFTAIHTAAAVGNVALMARLVGDRSTIDRQAESVRTPLNQAVMADDSSAVACALALGSNPSRQAACWDSFTVFGSLSLWHCSPTSLRLLLHFSIMVPRLGTVARSPTSRRFSGRLSGK
ncbi:ankyrin repeat domain protein [Colletotrichum sojae]|uniref:protein S-acyltransferase n=1 Tax=Colletotrichum sojae TaxID=2175907 RepID=A0A8H6INE6_9PEZI|nr:ankyrin repeat domain protein [Colletotrichum sojae]